MDTTAPPMQADVPCMRSPPGDFPRTVGYVHRCTAGAPVPPIIRRTHPTHLSNYDGSLTLCDNLSAPAVDLIPFPNHSCLGAKPQTVL